MNEALDVNVAVVCKSLCTFFLREENEIDEVAESTVSFDEEIFTKGNKPKREMFRYFSANPNVFDPFFPGIKTYRFDIADTSIVTKWEDFGLVSQGFIGLGRSHQAGIADTSIVTTPTVSKWEDDGLISAIGNRQLIVSYPSMCRTDVIWSDSIGEQYFTPQILHRNHEEVVSYLENNPEISGFVNKCGQDLVKFFGSSVSIVLEVMEHHTESDSYKELIGWIQSTDDVQNGMEKLEKFEDIWLQDQINKLGNKFNFNIEFI